MVRAIAAAVLAAFAPAGASGQTAPAAPTAAAFEVASIKPNKSGTGNSSTHTSRGEIRFENVSLKRLIERAYDLKDYSLSAPEWLESERFDIVAKPPAKPGGTRGVEYKPLLQSLLVERFKLAYHREPKTIPAYALVVAKGGSKLQPVERGGESGTSSGRTRITGVKVSMDEIADQLAQQLDKPVQNLTGIDGVFSYKLEWTADEEPAPPKPDGGQPATANVPAGPSLFSALQEQLGLKLEARRLPVEILVVDHVERAPTEN